MLKTILLATSMCIAVPAFAQETPAPDTQTQDQAPVSEPVAEAQNAPTPADPATAAPSETAVAEPAPAPAQPVSEQDRVAGIVNSEFASYDKDGNGTLDVTEFGAWIVALRVKAQPDFVADSADGKAWVSAAFKQADADKNASINPTELTTFLTPKPAA